MKGMAGFIEHKGRIINLFKLLINEDTYCDRRDHLS